MITLDISDLDAVRILSDEIMLEVIEEKDIVDRERIILELTDKAKILGVKLKFEKILSAFQKKEKEYLAQEKSRKQDTFRNYTSFGGTYDVLFCGNWIADESGVRLFTMFGERLACYHPILPIQRLINAETGKEKVKLAFRKGYEWKEIIVEKGVIASSNKIVSLADYGVSVTSETAKTLVSFLADLENFNINQIKTQISTSKLGWMKGEFMPYGQDIIFDNEIKFKSTYNSIHQEGGRDNWYQLVKEIRNSAKIEPKIYLAGSLASVLIEPLNALPFLLNLWGDTGKGKTVNMMLAASVWAYPGGNDYVIDPKSTITALELRLDFLNNFPILIDDMAQLKERYSGDFSELVYLLCSGKGKDRANASLGINKPTSWRNIILTNSEHSLITDTMQGGAVNRVIDVEMSDGYLFENGNRVVEIIKNNYGFCGQEFVEAIKGIGFDEIKKMQHNFLEQINQKAKELGLEKEEKQSLPMSILLTADKIATDYLFKDHIYLNFNTCFEFLKNKGEVSENERAYEFILSEIAINILKFQPDSRGEYKGEVWGCMEKGCAVILNNAFNRICEKGNFSGKAFLSWAAKKNLIQTGSDGKNSKNKRMNGAQCRCIYINLPKEESDFSKIDKMEQKQIELLFE